VGEEIVGVEIVGAVGAIGAPQWAQVIDDAP